jgi:tRNA dimethylallyltransferase
VIVAIFGPTAVGKTGIAIELAERLRERGEHPAAVSADAFQVYSGLEILSARPTEAELARLEHRLVSCVPIDAAFSVAEYAGRAHEEIDSLLGLGRRPIVLGGTGLYFRAALAELQLKPPPESGLREEVERDLVELGLKALHGQLPGEVAETVHPNDRKRIVRALELERMGHEPYAGSEELWSGRLRRPAAIFGLVMDREALARRISERVKEMLEDGLVAEVERALERGASPTARKAIGFREAEAHLAGEISVEEAAERIERRHRQYAKRQMTWLRKLPGAQLIDRTGLSEAEAAAALVERLETAADAPSARLGSTLRGVGSKPLAEL